MTKKGEVHLNERGMLTKQLSEGSLRVCHGVGIEGERML